MAIKTRHGNKWKKIGKWKEYDGPVNNYVNLNKQSKWRYKEVDLGERSTTYFNKNNKKKYFR